MIFAVDLASRSSGWVLLDTSEQPYRVVAHGVVSIKGEWGPLAWEETQRAWKDMLDGYTHQFFDSPPFIELDCIAYEVPGWAGQSGASRSGHGTSYRTREMLIGADHLFGAVAAGHARRVMRLDQADVKEAIAGDRRANKDSVAEALALREQDGEWSAPNDADGTWSDHEIDSLAVALYAAALLQQEVLR